MRKTLSTIWCMLLVLFAAAQDHTDTLSRLMKKAGIPGLSLAYLKDGKLKEHYSLGVKSSETMLPVNDSTIFSAASLSKSVFSYAVFKLIQEKKLDLDKPLYTYYIYKDVADDPRSKLVTARMILSHSAGLPNWRDNDTLHFKLNPGEKYNYSGEGMVWLSRVVEAITGQNIESYISEKIFRPLKMNHTSYIWQKSFGDNYAYPHIDIPQTESKNFPSEPNVAHSLQTTALDYAKFLTKVLQDKSFMTALQQEPTMPVKDQISWGMGFGHQNSKDGIAFFQWGDNGTFKAYLIGYPGKKESLVYFANSYHGLKIAKDILAIYFNSEQPALAWLETGSADAPDLQVFEHMLNGSIKQAVTPYYAPGKNYIDTSRLSLAAVSYLGNRLIRLHRYNKAIEMFTEGLKADASNAGFYEGIGEASMRMGDRAAALTAYSDAAKRDSANRLYKNMVSKLKGIQPTPEANEKMIVFRLPDYMPAQHVSLVGTFNDWNDIVEPMHWENGAWTTTIPLQKGKYRYKFVVDGVWLMDTRNPAFTPGSFDSELVID